MRGRAAILGVGLGLVVMLAAGARAQVGSAPLFGVAEDLPKYESDGGAFVYGRLRELGMRTIRLVVYFDANNPTTIQERSNIERALPSAFANGIDVVFSVYPRDPRAFSVDTDTRVRLYGQYLALLARTYPRVKKYVLLNEPNEPFFLVPQFGAGGVVLSAEVAMKALAAGYDALTGVDPTITVIGLGLSNDGNGVSSVPPVRFLKALGDAYKSSGRTRPLMDRLGIHMHAADARSWDATSTLPWPNVGPANLDRIKQAFWDAFNGTGQPTFAEAASYRLGPSAQANATMDVMELGVQSAVSEALRPLYTGRENVEVATEVGQAASYDSVLRALACDPAVTALLIFLLVDQRELDRFQSGLLRIDRSARPSLAAVRAAIAQARDCAALVAWRHIERVLGARVAFPERTKFNETQRVLGATVSASEEANARLELYRVSGPGGSPGPNDTPLLTDSVLVRVGFQPRLEVRGTLGEGFYVLVARFAATMNPSRTSVFTSDVLTVGDPDVTPTGNEPPTGFTKKQYEAVLNTNVRTLTPLIATTSAMTGEAGDLAAVLALVANDPNFAPLFTSGAAAGVFFARTGELNLKLRRTLRLLRAELRRVRTKKSGYRLPQGARVPESPVQLPTPGYKSVPNPRAPAPPPTKPGKSVSSQTAAAATELNRSLTRIGGFVSAYSVALDRAYAAFRARAGSYARVQLRAASRFATGAAKSLDSFRLRLRVLARTIATGMTTAQLIQLQARFNQAGFSPSLLGVLRGLGMKGPEIVALRKRVSVTALRTPFPQALLDKQTQTAARVLADNFRLYARLLRV